MVVEGNLEGLAYGCDLLGRDPVRAAGRERVNAHRKIWPGSATVAEADPVVRTATQVTLAGAPSRPLRLLRTPASREAMLRRDQQNRLGVSDERGSTQLVATDPVEAE